jgi:hypothetical protein
MNTLRYEVCPACIAVVIEPEVGRFGEIGSADIDAVELALIV